MSGPSPEESNGSNSAVALGVAVTIVLSALVGGGVGGGVGGATSISEASSEFGARVPKSEEPEAQTTGIRDAFKVTSRLERLGYRVTFQTEHTDRQCAANFDGDVQVFFRTTECLSLYRVVYEIQAKYGTPLPSMATVVMPDEQAAIDLRALLDQATRGKIIPLIPPNGKYRHFAFLDALACTTRNGATVTAYDAKAVGHTLDSAVLYTLLTSVLSGSC